MTEKYENVLCRWFEEVWNQRREEVIDELFVREGQGYGLETSQSLSEDTDNSDSIKGPEEFKGFFKSYTSAFPDIKNRVLDTFSAADKIIVRCVITGTHTGEGLEIPPTNRKVEFTGMCIVRVEDGKIREAWNNFDFLTMYQQLGVLKPISKEKTA